jgi:hypothetical protein
MKNTLKIFTLPIKIIYTVCIQKLYRVFLQLFPVVSDVLCVIQETQKVLPKHKTQTPPYAALYIDDQVEMPS